MYTKLDNERSIIVNLGEFLSIQFITAKAYPFIEAYIVARKYLEETTRYNEQVFNSATETGNYVRDNNWCAFSLNTSTGFTPEDYMFIFTGIDAEGKREEITRYIVSFREC